MKKKINKMMCERKIPASRCETLEMRAAKMKSNMKFSKHVKKKM